jgi:D-sedoheptulose 7-phosphate isomerase
MNEQHWLSNYFDHFSETCMRPDLYAQLVELKDWLIDTQARGNKVILAGNGASAAISSHVAVDFSKTAGIRAVNFNEADLITCLGNDYGYENWVAKALEIYADEGDLIILISSSGQSPNMLKAAEYANQRGLKLVTFTGFSDLNVLRTKGDLNFWADSTAYNIVESTHHFWLLAVCDLIVQAGQKQITETTLLPRES